MHVRMCMQGISVGGGDGRCVGMLRDVMRGVGGHEVAREAGPRACEGGILPLRRELNSNKLTGTIPTALGDLSSLQTL